MNKPPYGRPRYDPTRRLWIRAACDRSRILCRRGGRRKGQSFRRTGRRWVTAAPRLPSLSAHALIGPYRAIPTSDVEPDLTMQPVQYVDCIICGSPCTGTSDIEAARIDCERCGKFVLSAPAEATIDGLFNEKPLRRSLMSFAIRRMQRSGIHPEKITRSTLPTFWSDERLPTLQAPKGSDFPLSTPARKAFGTPRRRISTQTTW
jgi:hypothetical protein